MAHIEFLNAAIVRLRQRLEQAVVPYAEQLGNLQTIWEVDRDDRSRPSAWHSYARHLEQRVIVSRSP